MPKTDDDVVLKVPVSRQLLDELKEGIDCAHLRWVKIDEHEDAFWITKGPREDQIDRGAEAIDDLLLQLGVEPTYAPEHAPSETVKRILARAVLEAALDSPARRSER